MNKGSQLVAAFCATLAAVAHAQGPGLPSTPAPTVLALDRFGLVVADLDVAVKFYRDVVGLPVVVAPRARQVNAARNASTGTAGAALRYAVLQVPNEPFALELDEYTGIERATMQSRHNDPGSSFLNFGVWDAGSAFETLRKAKPNIVSKSGIPSGEGPGLKAVWLRDPDGHLLELMQGGWDPERKSMVGLQRVYRAHFGMTMLHYEDALSFYRELLGFDLTAGFPPMVAAGQYLPARGLAAMVGIPPEASMAAVAGHCAYARCEMFEFKDAPRTPFHPRMQDPGAAYLSVWVSDLDALLAKAQAEGLEVITPGGAPALVESQDLSLYPGRDTQGPVRVHHSRDVVIRDPAGFPVLLRQRVD